MKRGSRWDELMTLLFMLLAGAAFVCFFAVKEQPYYMILMGIAVVLRLIQYALRFFS